MEEKTTTKKVRVYQKECPICNKKFESQNLKQLRYNFQLHLGACKLKLKGGKSK